jgi:hypothetical protein
VEGSTCCDGFRGINWRGKSSVIGSKASVSEVSVM